MSSSEDVGKVSSDSASNEDEEYVAFSNDVFSEAETSEGELHLTKSPDVESDEAGHHQQEASEYIMSEPQELSKRQFATICNEYSDVLDALKKGTSCRNFFPEMSRMLYEFRRVFSTQHLLKEKVREMRGLLNSEETLDEMHVHQIEEEEALIESLKEELAYAEKNRCQILKAKDDLAEELVAAIGEIEVQKALVEETQKKAEANFLQKQLVRLQEESAQVTQDYQVRFTKLKSQLAEKDLKLAEMQQTVAHAYENVARRESEASLLRKSHKAEEIRRKTAEVDVENLKNTLREKNDSIEQTSLQLSQKTSELEVVKAKALKFEGESRKWKKDTDKLSKFCEKMKYDSARRDERLTSALGEIGELQETFKEKTFEIRGLQNDLFSVKKEKLTLEKTTGTLENAKMQLEQKIEVLLKDIASSKRKMEDATKAHEVVSNQLAEAEKAKTQMSEKITKCESSIAQLEQQSKFLEESLNAREAEAKSVNAKLDREKQRLKESELDRNKLNGDIRNLCMQINNLKEKIVLSQYDVDKLTKEVESWKQKLRATEEKSKETAVSAFRLKKSLEESKEEISQYKTHIESLEKYVVLMKDNIRNGENEHMKQLTKIDQLQTEVSGLRTRLTKQTTEAQDARVQVRKLNHEVQTMSKDAAHKEKELDRVKREMKSVEEERDRVISQLSDVEKVCGGLQEDIRNLNDDIALKIKITNAQDDDIRVLKTELVTMKTSARLLEQKLTTFDATRKRLLTIQQELTESRRKVKALEVDANKPMNIHNIRLLKGSDPEKEQLITKCRFLQKKLLEKGDGLEHTTQEIEERDKQICILREQVEKQPSTEVLHSLSMAKARCRELQSKCNGLNAQVNMYESVCHSLEVENKSLKEFLSKLNTAEYVELVNQRGKSQPTSK